MSSIEELREALFALEPVDRGTNGYHPPAEKLLKAIEELAELRAKETDLKKREDEHAASRVALDRLFAGADGGLPISDAVNKLIGDGMIERAIAVLLNDPQDREFVFVRSQWNKSGRQVLQVVLQELDVEQGNALEMSLRAYVLSLGEGGPAPRATLKNALREGMRRGERVSMRDFVLETMGAPPDRALFDRSIDGTRSRRRIGQTEGTLVQRCESISPWGAQCNLGTGHQGPHVPWEGNPPTNVIPWVDDPDPIARAQRASEPIPDARDFRSPPAAFTGHAFVPGNEAGVSGPCAECGEHRDTQPHREAEELLGRMVADLAPIPTLEQLNARRAQLGLAPMPDEPPTSLVHVLSGGRGLCGWAVGGAGRWVSVTSLAAMTNEVTCPACAAEVVRLRDG